jgi:Mn-dependent DtxR family transcriptional regulator
MGDKVLQDAIRSLLIDGPLPSNAIARKIRTSEAIVLLELVHLAREGLVSMRYGKWFITDVRK